jgi:excinuclease ABC subunit C
MSLAERADRLPTTSGVYLFKNARGAVLYVGKAQNLRSRVKQYVLGGDGRFTIPKLLDRAVDVDVVVTPSVKDALLLENELIKRHKPPFNVRLRDDKQYLALRLDPRETWPRLREVRRFADDGAALLRAVHLERGDARGAVEPAADLSAALVQRGHVQGLRAARAAVHRVRDEALPRAVLRADRHRRVRRPGVGHGDVPARALDELVNALRERMKGAAEAEQFEEAARLRDRIGAVERTVERQQIVGLRRADRDVFGLARRGGDVEVHVLHVREGRVIGAQGYPLDDVALDDGW